MWKKIKKDIITNKWVYVMTIPMLAYYIIFCYVPMYGASIAFKDFQPAVGIIGSPWVGFKHFESFFTGVYFVRTIRNTLILSFELIIFGFPAPIILALLFNEIRQNWFKRLAQTISYIPYFISLVVMCGLIVNFTSSTGLINDIIELLGGDRVTMLLHPQYYRPIYIISEIYQTVGWSSIIYLAALSNVDSELYEAAAIDGCGKLRMVSAVTLPSIMPTIVIMFILRIGSLMNIGYEKTLLLYNSSTFEVADIISTFVYRKGLLEFSYSYSTAVGLFNSIINFALLLIANAISRKVNETSLW
ncbi:MAG: ABC transporter permease [Candidatus Merdivicinus sp.]|jgi:putative aldouronate transport system permease protein